MLKNYLAKTVGIILVSGGLIGCSAPSRPTTTSPAAQSDASTQPAPMVKTTHAYKSTPDGDIHADVYRPSSVSKPTPVIVFIHGGALIMGARDGVNRQHLDAYVRAGYTVVSIDYRLAPEAKLPAIMEDLRDAFRWVRETAPRLFPIDPQRMAVIGHSAGGFLTLISGFIISPRPKALVSYYGYCDISSDWLNKPDPFYSTMPAVTREKAYACIGFLKEPNSNVDRWPFYLYCRQQGEWAREITGHDPVKEPAAYDKFCTIRNVTAKYPPTLLLHGDKDTDVPYEQSVIMAEKLSRFGVEHQLITIPGGAHGFDSDTGDPVARDAFNAVMVFLKKHL